MPQISIFDLLQTVDTPQAQDIQNWIASMFPKASDRASFLLAIQLEKLFEMAVYENQVDTVHLLLQQGIAPDIRSDWGTTPLMWAHCLDYTQIIKLLESYGADQYAKSFSQKVASDFSPQMNANLPEYQSIIKRRAEIHAQVTAGYLKPFGSAISSVGGTPNKKAKRCRQIENSKGIDEVFKQTEQGRRRSREINVTFE